MRVKCLAREHNTMTQPGLEPGPLDPESSALTIIIRPRRLPCGFLKGGILVEAFYTELREDQASLILY